jgi:hypothetical protein
MLCAAPSNATSRARVTTRVTPVGASVSLRIKTRSVTAPKRGATTNRTSGRASSTGQWWWTVSSQYKKAINMPTAPWAKLKIPDVV